MVIDTLDVLLLPRGSSADSTKASIPLKPLFGA